MFSGATRNHESGVAMSRLMATWRCRVRAAPRLRRASRPRHRQPFGFHRPADTNVAFATHEISRIATNCVAPTSDISLPVSYDAEVGVATSGFAHPYPIPRSAFVKPAKQAYS